MIYKGILEIDEYGCLKCGDSYLVEDVEADFKKGDNVFVRYYVTDKEVTEEEAKEALILKTIGGNVDELEFVLDAYSEYTIMELEEHLVVGGHDLFNELQDCEGKFLTLIIEAVSQPFLLTSMAWRWFGFEKQQFNRVTKLKLKI